MAKYRIIEHDTDCDYAKYEVEERVSFLGLKFWCKPGEYGTFASSKKEAKEKVRRLERDRTRKPSRVVDEL